MTGRDIAVVSTLATLLALTPGLAAAQTADTPRTAWGDPDLGGIWDYSSLTPMSRPREFVDKAVLTEEESAAFLRQQLAFYEALDDGKTVPGNEVPSRVFVDAGTTVVPDQLADRRPTHRPTSTDGRGRGGAARGEPQLLRPAPLRLV